MSDATTDKPTPSPEVQQLVMLGDTQQAVLLYAKQADLDPDSARVVIDRLADE